MRANTIEAEIDAIRLEIYEETKHLTDEEQIKRVNEKAQKLAAQFGFKIGRPASVIRYEQDDTTI